MTQYHENTLPHPDPQTQSDSDTRQPPLKRENEVVPAGVPVDTQTQDNLLAFESERKDQTDVFDVDVALKSVTSELSPELLGDIRSYVELPDSTDAIRHIQRAEFLPHLFRLRGQPYSLKNREPFYVMFDNEYVPETLFLTGRQEGKSTGLAHSEVLDILSVPELQLLYVAPLQSQTQRFSTLSLTPAIQSCELARCLQSKSLEGTLSDSKIVTAVGHQSFANGSGIQLTYAKTSPDRARGIFADRIDFDEVQDQLIDNMPIIAESLTASKWGVRKYTGTAKTIDNTIELLWQSSSKCEWVMKCDHCGAWNIPNMEGRVLDMIQADGMHCVTCGGRIDTHNGLWVPEHPDRMQDFRGYHIPQVVLPAFAENPETWAKLIRKLLHQPLPLFIQECLGISQSVGSRIITEADIKRQCVLPGIKEIEQWKDMYAYRVLAIDWGGAEQSSFTVCVVLGIRTDGRIDVLWAKRYIGFDPDDVFVDIAQTYKYYQCHAASADYGMGFDKNIILEKRFGLKMTQFMFVRQNKLLTYSPSLGHARWTIDKTTALDILFMSIKNQRVYFPPYDTFEIYLRDLLSPYEEVSETGGFTTRRYLRDPSRPDDFCMSLCFGVMLAMKMLYGDDEINIIPAKAFGGGSIPDGAPVDNPIDPQDVMSSIG